MKIFASILKNPLISGSIILFVGSFSSNILSYIFNLLLGRFLTVSDYGTYAALISIMGLFGIFPSAFTQIFAKFAAVYKASNSVLKTKILFVTGFKIILAFASIFLILQVISIFFVSSFLHISNPIYLLMVFLAIFLSIIGSLPIGVLQGELRIYTLASVFVITPFFKMLIGFVLLFLGLGLLGVSFAIIVSSFISFCFVILLFRSYFDKSTLTKKNESTFFNEFKKYSINFFLASVGVTILTTIDMLFVKHYFSPVQAGQYAALSVMGRSIFYITSPIYSVFFPLIAQKNEKKRKYSRYIVSCDINYFSRDSGSINSIFSIPISYS